LLIVEFALITLDVFEDRVIADVHEELEDDIEVEA
jgi:hypothetical protein